VGKQEADAYFVLEDLIVRTQSIAQERLAHLMSRLLKRLLAHGWLRGTKRYELRKVDMEAASQLFWVFSKNGNFPLTYKELKAELGDASSGLTVSMEHLHAAGILYRDFRDGTIRWSLNLIPRTQYEPEAEITEPVAAESVASRKDDEALTEQIISEKQSAEKEEPARRTGVVWEIVEFVRRKGGTATERGLKKALDRHGHEVYVALRQMVRSGVFTFEKKTTPRGQSAYVVTLTQEWRQAVAALTGESKSFDMEPTSQKLVTIGDTPVIASPLSGQDASVPVVPVEIPLSRPPKVSRG